jgi:tryptophan synthase alpha chain
VTRLESALKERLVVGGRALVPYVTGGLAGVDASLLRALEGAGADALEVGIPFSDPVMDGPVIQEASRRALETGARPGGVLETIAAAGLGIPVVVMTYLNPVLSRSEEGFVRAAAAAGVAGVIVPDLPVDEADGWRETCRAEGLASVFLAAPGTDAARLRLVGEASEGFVYCVSTYGVTGARGELAGTSREVVEALRALTDRPLLVGVGISTPEQAAAACGFADGVVVGSALVERLLEGDVDGALGLFGRFREAVPAGAGAQAEGARG